MTRQGPRPKSAMDRVGILLEAIGLDSKSFERFLEFALCEHLVFALRGDPEITPGLFQRPDALKQFRSLVIAHTLREWSLEDLEALFERVKAEVSHHYREPIMYGEYLKLLWQVPLECARCHRKPPDVKLHIDHVVPVSRGGRSKRENLQFLCEADNLKKADQREVSSPWLTLR